MSRAKTHLVTILPVLHLVFSWSWPVASALASEGYCGKPLVIPITKDDSTSLYTIPLDDCRLFLDLSGPLVWSTCEASHETFQLHERECADANRYTLPRSWAQIGQDHQPADSYKFFSGKCAAHPYNPFSGECAAGDLTRARLSMNATDGRNPLYPVSFSVLASCAPGTLLASLHAGAVGVTGLSSSELALPAQVATAQKIAKKFALCLGRRGAAIFGGGPFFLMSRWGVPDMVPTRGTPSQGNTDFSGRYHYYIKAKGLAVNHERLPLFDHELSVALSPRDRNTALQSDVYGAFLRAYDQATSGYSRVTLPVAPFGLCFDTRNMISTRFGYVMPQVDLMLDGGWNWTMDGNSLVQINDQTVCLAFVERKQVDTRAAIVIGGYQMEDNLFLFDLEKMQLGISGLLWSSTNCGNFNFTVGV